MLIPVIVGTCGPDLVVNTFIVESQFSIEDSVELYVPKSCQDGDFSGEYPNPTKVLLVSIVAFE